MYDVSMSRFSSAPEVTKPQDAYLYSVSLFFSLRTICMFVHIVQALAQIHESVDHRSRAPSLSLEALHRSARQAAASMAISSSREIHLQASTGGSNNSSNNSSPTKRLSRSVMSFISGHRSSRHTTPPRSHNSDPSCESPPDNNNVLFALAPSRAPSARAFGQPSSTGPTSSTSTPPPESNLAAKATAAKVSPLKGLIGKITGPS